MPSFTKFTFVSTVALALLSITAPVMARVNHADLYGYPHNRGPARDPRQPMTPGGFRDPRPANPGAQCNRNNQCSTDVMNARASCGADGVCGFQCLGNTVLNNGQCTGMIVASRCSFDRQCPTTVGDATGVCVAGRCNFACNTGFFAQGSTCVPDDKVCGVTTCPEVDGGYSVCVDGQCTARCESHLGFAQYCNADRTTCQCINTANDALNCGTPGNVCPPSYNGKGQAYCAAGVCGLSCNRLTKVTPRDAPAYCV